MVPWFGWSYHPSPRDCGSGEGTTVGRTEHMYPGSEQLLPVTCRRFFRPLAHRSERDRGGLALMQLLFQGEESGQIACQSTPSQDKFKESQC